MKQQTAVDWLSEQLRFTDKEAYAELYETIQQAKAMEKEQMIKAYKEARQIGCQCYDDLDDKNAEPYYNETYKL
jgi:hypothetical protein